MRLLQMHSKIVKINKKGKCRHSKNIMFVSFKFIQEMYEDC